MYYLNDFFARTLHCGYNYLIINSKEILAWKGHVIIT